MNREQAKDYLYDIASQFGKTATGEGIVEAVDVLAEQGEALTIKNVEGYTINVADEMVVIRKGKKLRAVFFGTIEHWVTLRQLVDAVINADGEK